MPHTYSLGPWKTELKLAHERYSAAFGQTPGTEFLSRAAEADDSFGEKKLSAAQKAKRLHGASAWARRESLIDDDEIQRLLGVVGEVSESSFESGYSLSTMLLAAAKGRASIGTRLNAAGTAANSAIAFEQWLSARSALTDYLESLGVLGRFFDVERDEMNTMRSAVVRGWPQLRERLGTTGELLDLPDSDAPKMLVEHVVANTDFGKGNGGYLPQVDAQARLVIRLEHWFEVQGGDAAALAAGWRRAVDATAIPVKLDQRGPRDRCVLTCADALLETGKYEAALQLYRSLLQQTEYGRSPLSAHAKIGLTLALHQQGRVEEARAALAAIDAHALKELAGIVLTVQAEWARFVATRGVLKVEPDTKEEGPESARKLVVEVGRILVASSKGRTGYLRTLFVGQMMRDVEAILAMR